MNPLPIPPQPTTVEGCRWLVSEDSAGLFPIHTGTAETEAAAWTAAYAAGRNALLAGRIRYLAIAVDDEIPTLGYSPSRDHHDQLDPNHVTQYLGELLQDTLRCLRPSGGQFCWTPCGHSGVQHWTEGL
jgi:hypothetical protein